MIILVWYFNVKICRFVKRLKTKKTLKSAAAPGANNLEARRKKRSIKRTRHISKRSDNDQNFGDNGSVSKKARQERRPNWKNVFSKNDKVPNFAVCKSNRSGGGKFAIFGRFGRRMGEAFATLKDEFGRF